MDASCLTTQSLSDDTLETPVVMMSPIDASTNTTQSLKAASLSEQDLPVSPSTKSKIFDVNKINAKRIGKENIQPVTSASIGDILFHKLSGHPSWPVEVTGMSNAG